MHLRCQGWANKPRTENRLQNNRNRARTDRNRLIRLLSRFTDWETRIYFSYFGHGPWLPELTQQPNRFLKYSKQQPSPLREVTRHQSIQLSPLRYSLFTNDTAPSPLREFPSHIPSWPPPCASPPTLHHGDRQQRRLSGKLHHTSALYFVCGQ